MFGVRALPLFVVLMSLVACRLDRRGYSGIPSEDGGDVFPSEDGGFREMDSAPSDSGSNDAGPALRDSRTATPCDDPRLVACYPLNGDADDHSARDNHLMAEGVVFDPGGFVSLDGTSGMTTSQTEPLHLSRPGLMAWTRVHELPSAERAVLIVRQGSYTISLDVQGHVRCAMPLFSVFQPLSPEPLSLGEWHHAACVVIGDEVVLFVDGVWSASQRLGEETPANEDRPLGVGQSPAGTNGLRGDLDDVRIYDAVLHEEDIVRAFFARN